jgi:hypothetical protein
MVPTFKLAVVTVGGAESVAIMPPWPTPNPVASQLTGLAHATPKREATPDGADSLVQLVPPSAVPTMFAPPTAVQVEELMHAMESRGVAPVGVPRSFHWDPPSVVSMACDPTAKHVASLTQEMLSREAAPAGGVCGVQVDPPFVVFRIAEPGPLEDRPTTLQCRESEQEMPENLETDAVYGSDVHVVPPLTVPMILGDDVPKSLTARQTEKLAQDIAVRMPTPAGTVSTLQLAPASTVPMMTELPKAPKPTAVQTEVVGHDMAVRPLTSAGTDWVVQAYPRFTEDRTELTPTAKQTAVVGHEIEFSGPVPDGSDSEAQDSPPLVVLMIVDPAPWLPVLPTAMQSSAPEQEIPVRSTAFAGALCDDQVEPAFEVPTT